MEDEMKTYYCERIKSYVHGEKMEDIAGRIIVHCKFYADYMHANNRNTCFLDTSNHKRCLVKLAVQKEAKVKLSP